MGIHHVNVIVYLTFVLNRLFMKILYMSERKRIYLCLAHMSEDGMEQKVIMVHG